MTPTLSVILTAKDEEPHILHQLRSILSQSRGCDQLVLLDDGSTDETGDIMLGALKDHKVISEPMGGWLEDDVAHVTSNPDAEVRPTWHLMAKPEPSGINQAFNLASKAATGDWCYFASANDLVLPGAFESWARAVETYPDARIIAGPPENSVVGWSPTMLYYETSQIQQLFKKQHLHGCGTFIRRDMWEKYGGYRVELGSLADFWLYNVVSLRHGMVYIPQSVARSGKEIASGHKDMDDHVARREIAGRIDELLAGEFADLKGAFENSILMKVIRN